VPLESQITSMQRTARSRIFLCCPGCPPDIAVAHRNQDGRGGVSPTWTPCGAKWSNSLVAHQVFFSTPRQPPTHFSLARRQAGPKNLFCTHRKLGRRILTNLTCEWDGYGITAKADSQLQAPTARSLLQKSETTPALSDSGLERLPTSHYHLPHITGL
jgi:hypothetical protein